MLRHVYDEGKADARKLRLAAATFLRRAHEFAHDEVVLLGIKVLEGLADGADIREELQALATLEARRASPPFEARDPAPDTDGRVAVAFDAYVLAALPVRPEEYYPDSYVYGRSGFDALGYNYLGSNAGQVMRAALVILFRATELHYPAGEEAARAEYVAQGRRIRDLFGNPFAVIATEIHPDWLAWGDGIVGKLAQEAYEEREQPSGLLSPTRLAVLADALEESGCADEDLLDHLREPGEHVRGCWAVDALLRKSPNPRLSEDEARDRCMDAKNLLEGAGWTVVSEILEPAQGSVYQVVATHGEKRIEARAAKMAEMAEVAEAWNHVVEQALALGMLKGR
jgi:hypothetical protein